jgi:hypothetical protein
VDLSAPQRHRGKTAGGRAVGQLIEALFIEATSGA